MNQLLTKSKNFHGIDSNLQTEFSNNADNVSWLEIAFLNMTLITYITEESTDRFDGIKPSGLSMSEILQTQLKHRQKHWGFVCYIYMQRVNKILLKVSKNKGNYCYHLLIWKNIGDS